MNEQDFMEMLTAEYAGGVEEAEELVAGAER